MPIQEELMQVVKSGNAESVKAFFEINDCTPADVNSLVGSNPALYTAAVRGYQKIAHILLEHGADSNVKNNYEYTPLHAAAQKGHQKVVELLLANGADPNAKSYYGYTPLQAAAKKGHREVAKVLLANGAGPNVPDHSGITALHFAAENNHVGIVELLLANGAAPNAADDDGYTPFQAAAKKGHREVVNVLLANGAGPNVEGKTRVTLTDIEAEELLRKAIITGLEMEGKAIPEHAKSVYPLLASNTTRGANDKIGKTSNNDTNAALFSGFAFLGVVIFVALVVALLQAYQWYNRDAGENPQRELGRNPDNSDRDDSDHNAGNENGPTDERKQSGELSDNPYQFLNASSGSEEEPSSEEESDPEEGITRGHGVQ